MSAGPPGDDRGKKMRKKLCFAIAAAAALCVFPMSAAADSFLTHVLESYEMNAENSYTISYLEQDPYLVNIYEGYGFAKDYMSARGHAYVLEDVAGTERPHPLANCLTCKTEDFTRLVNEMGEDAYSLDFEEVYADAHQNVGCYSCHGDDFPTGKLVLTHDYSVTAIGDDMGDTIAPAIAVCGQCHTEYYFKPENKATNVPYTDIASMDPAAELAYYDEMGFADWVQESTGTPLLKVQHPEIETVLGEGNIHARMGLSCADCHMEKTTTDEGRDFKSHYLKSPLDSEELLTTCAQCHKDTDMAEKVHTLQAEITARETEVGEKLSALKDALAEAVASGDYTEEELDEIRSLHRTAQWYFDWDYVENSEGAHNSALARKCLDTAEETIDEAMGLFES